MHKNLYKFTIKKNKCDITIKSTIKKRTISGEKKWLRERERESITFFFSMDNLERIGERCGKEVTRN